MNDKEELGPEYWMGFWYSECIKLGRKLEEREIHMEMTQAKNESLFMQIEELQKQIALLRKEAQSNA